MVAWSFRIIQPLFKNQNCGCFKNHKKSKLCHKVIIFISLESSCVTLRTVHVFFLFPILLSSYLDFCEKFLKKFKKILKNNDVRYGNSACTVRPSVTPLQVPLISS